MKNRLYSLPLISLLVIALGFSGCRKYLDILPKGNKIPTTLADYEALMRDEYSACRVDIGQTILLLNDRFETPLNLNYYPLYNANYNWDESADRIKLNNNDEGVYYSGYMSISTYNLIINYTPDATEATTEQKEQLIAQAKVARALNYFVLANYYADTYQAADAGSKLSVPLILSADINAPHTQVTIRELYDFMLKDIQDAIPFLPARGATILHATRGAAHALAARIYLQMGEYAQALTSANAALKENDQLFDWTQFYESYKTQIETPGVYTRAASPMGYTYVENYIYRHGFRIYSTVESNLRIDRAARFEAGDARFASRWKLRTVGADTYYYSITNGYYNYGGLTTTEMYLVKAECLARQNDISGAMDMLNAVRIKRILPANYQPLTAASVKEAVELVQRTKQNELIFSIVPFADARRLNKEADYARTLTKTENGKTLTLLPTSHLWTMPFPLGAINNPGNGTIKQNVDK